MIQLEILRYGYLFVFLGTLVEGDATLLSASFLARRGYLRIWEVTAIAVLADQVYYLLARRKGAAWLESRTEAGSRLLRVKRWANEHGGLLMMASRFMFGFRTLIPAVCGASGMTPFRFLGWNFAGAVIWAVTFAAVGYAGGPALSGLLEEIRRHERLIAFGIAIGTILFVGLRTRGKDWIEAARFLRSRG